ncbi:MAG: hypothetical protein NC305_05580 [Lachnospiraceae bacterium]|nr:hypothetical protein [Muribaculaceae bacterium]MCM1410000.1 hypothetical protein [Lachnospiraceae bacterium]
MINKVDGNNYNVYTKPNKVDIPATDEKFSLGYQKDGSSSGAKDKGQVPGEEKQQALERSGVRLELSVGGQAADADRRKQAEAETTKAQGASQQTSLLETIRTYIVAAITAVREFFYNIWNDQPSEKGSQDARSLESNPQDAGSSEGISEDTQLVESDSQEFQSLADIVREDPLVEGDPQSARRSGTVLQDALSGTSQLPEEIIDASDERSARALEEERRNREIRQSLREGNMEHVISLLTDNGRKTVAKNSTLLTSYDKNGRVVEPSASDRERALHGDKNSWKL